jgi:hypothetical protein
MRISITPFLFVFTLLKLSGQDSQKLPEIRNLYLDAGRNPEKREYFLNYFDKTSINDPLIYAYYATAITMYSENIKGKFNQLKTFNYGREKLDSLISTNPELAEPRYLRFDIQEHVPVFLNYNNNIEDKEIIIKNIKEIQCINNNILKSRIKEILINSSSLTSSEKSIVEANL